MSRSPALSCKPGIEAPSLVVRRHHGGWIPWIGPCCEGSGPTGYSGSKATPGLCRALIALMPPHGVHVESRPGGGALMKRKPPAERSIGIDRDVRVLEALARAYPVERVHGRAHEFLSCFPFRGPEPVCGDPPYLHATRRSRRRCRFDGTEAGHVALPELLGALPCRVMVSGHPSALHDRQPAGWRRLSMQVMTRGIVRTEVVWFDLAPDRLHRAGRNFTDRQRIRRKAAIMAAEAEDPVRS